MIVHRALCADLPNRPANAAPLPRPKMEELRISLENKILADSVAAGDGTAKGKGGGRGADDRFLQTVLHSGTVSDRVAAMTLVVQQAPLLRISVLDRYCVSRLYPLCLRVRVGTSAW